MIDFVPLTLEQAPLLKRYFSQSRTRLCDQTLGGALMWRNAFRTQFAEYEGCLFLRSETSPGKWAYTAPLFDLKKGVELLLMHCKGYGEELVFCSVGAEDKDAICALLPGYQATSTRDWFDYVYKVEKLSTFQGKKLSGQRNHRNFFLKHNARWHFEEITKENLPLIRQFFDQYCQRNEKDSPHFYEEEKAVLEVLDHLDVYGFFGGAIFVEDQVVAFSLGEIVGDTIFVHIEKADRDVRGSYQMIVSEFLSHFATSQVFFVNREEDVGDPGLRYSKESYHPEFMVEKYTIEGEM